MKRKDIEKEVKDENDNLEEELTINQSEGELEKSDADKLADMQKQYDELNDSFLRLNAEFDNYRKRTLKEKSDLLKLGSERVLLDIISVADDLERALENMDKATDIDSLKEGISLIYSKFAAFLSKHNVVEIESIDQPFDTDKHEALTTIPAEKEEDKDKIVDCVQKGYTLDDKVIRYSKVIVAK